MTDLEEQNLSSCAILPETIKITIIDDDNLIVDLLSNYLDSVTNFNVISSYLGGNPFLRELHNTNYPDILLLDLKMKDGNGTDVINIVVKQFPEIKIIVLSSYYNSNYIGYMFRLGVNAFLPKETDKELLVYAIKEVIEKGYFFDNEQVVVLRKQISNKAPKLKLNNKDKLTEREIDVLKLLCHQMTAQEISDKLFISKRTVDTHKSSMLSKTGAKNMAGLIIFASQNNILNLKEVLL